MPTTSWLVFAALGWLFTSCIVCAAYGIGREHGKRQARDEMSVAALYRTLEDREEDG